MHFLVSLILLVVWMGGIAAQNAEPFWMDAITHQGLTPFNPDKGYKVYRNVKDFGARGDGVTDDTAAINAAISSGNRCGGPASCSGSTMTPAIVYFPAGTYLISTSIVDFYYTQIVGDPRNMPTIKATPGFVANIIGMLDADSYTNGKLKYASTNVFYRQLRNIRFDTTDVPGEVAAVHWPSAQSTSIQNCVFVLSPDASRHHTGVFMEEGSGGFLGDLVFYGGEYGCQLGSQQYTVRNLTFFNAQTAILQIWDWTFTYKSIFVYNCQVGLNMSGPVVGSVAMLDSGFYNTATGIISGRPASASKPAAGSLILENVVFRNVETAVISPNGTLISGNPSGSVLQKYFAFGNIYTPNGPIVNQSASDVYFPQLANLKLGNRYLERSKPQYDDISASRFLSAREFGAKGDGIADDTDALNALFLNASKSFTNRIAFVDAGYYLVSDTVRIPPNTRIVGEALAAVILGAGPKFQDINAPYPVVQVGKPGETGYIEWSDMVVSTQGPTAGAILIEYNLATETGPCAAVFPPSGMWDVHGRVGGFAGSQLQVTQCGKTPQASNYVNPDCIAAYMSMHITKSASNLYMENNWFWVADHDIEDPQSTQISVFGGRGLLIESEKGPLWLLGTCVEHHVKYQYQLANTQNIWMGVIQTETPYFQPNPPAPAPFTTVDTTRHDPDFVVDCNGTLTSPVGIPPCAMAWGLRIVESHNVSIYGAGLYSFFNNYDTSCSFPGNGERCQERMVYAGMTNGASKNETFARMLTPKGGQNEDVTDIDIYNLNTIGAVSMINRQGVSVASFLENVAGYTSCIALFRFSGASNETFDVDGSYGASDARWDSATAASFVAHEVAENIASSLTADASNTDVPVGTSLLTLTPTSGVSFPGPLPSQTDCKFDYVW